MNNTLINPIEKASEIAEEMVLNYYKNKYPNIIKGIDFMIYNTDSNGDIRYTEDAQEIFNKYYDLVLTILEK